MCTFTMGFLIKPSRPRLLISSTWFQLSDCSMAVLAELLVYRTCNDYYFSLCGECMAVSNQPFIFLIHPHLPTTLPSHYSTYSRRLFVFWWTVVEVDVVSREKEEIRRRHFSHFPIFIFNLYNSPIIWIDNNIMVGRGSKGATSPPFPNFWINEDTSVFKKHTIKDGILGPVCD